MNQRSTVTPTPAQEQAALAWLSLLHDQPSSGDQATFSQWLQADPAHVEAYAQAQVLWELSEQPARTLAAEDAQALQGLLQRMDGAKGACPPTLVGGAGDGCQCAVGSGPGSWLATAPLGRRPGGRLRFVPGAGAHGGPCRSQ